MASAQAEAGGVVSYDTIEYTYDTRGNILQKTYSLDNTVVDTITVIQILHVYKKDGRVNLNATVFL